MKSLLPNGTRGGGSWDEPPEWPPDLFAVSASIVDKYDTYPMFLDEESPLAEIKLPATLSSLQEIAKGWAQEDKEQPAVADLWSTIYDAFHLEVSEASSNSSWLTAIHKLLIIGDEASAGIGFFSKSGSWIRRYYQYLNSEVSDIRLTKNQRPSCCIHVPNEVACVQPKTRTPMIGCTTRSLSHHLALLPPSSSVHVSWHPTDSINELNDSADVFNILTIPFPYCVPASSAKAILGDDEIAPGYGKFEFEQTWIEGKEVDLVDHVANLYRQALRDVPTLDAIVLPEMALNETAYNALEQEFLKPEYSGLQALISGVKTDEGNRNSAFTTYFDESREGNRGIWRGAQHKHHRWKLDKSQISAYSLGSALSPSRDWWENINVTDRSVHFYVFRRGACFTTLVCEDLARVDPCQTIIRAVGPNLVFALLMDGPQLRDRWPGRYAMTLADDPGSSVLSLTSLGLMRRSSYLFRSRECVALWRDSQGETNEIEIPAGAHGLLISLSRETHEEFTLDGRGDGGSAYSWTLTGSTSVVNSHCKLDE